MKFDCTGEHCVIKQTCLLEDGGGFAGVWMSLTPEAENLASPSISLLG